MRIFVRFIQNYLNMKKPIKNKTKKRKFDIEAFSKAISQDPGNNSLLDQIKTNVKFTILPTPIKSESDKKEYKVIRLENGLTVCLVSDQAPIVYDSDEETDTETEEEEEEEDSVEETEDESSDDDELPPLPEQKMAAAALCIGVGSFSDPKDVQGMAHFLEHMVFMGSEKYPQENDFDSFISKRGGSDNASTDCEVTTFYFECLEKHLYAALDRFAQFFTAPLMKKGAIAREREAIESEFQIAMPSDSNRSEQLLMSFAKSESPVNTFTWGNMITLKEQVEDDVLYQKLHDFRKRHYSANRMNLAIQARLPMNVLEAFVLNCFGAVPSNSLPPDNFKSFIDVFQTHQFHRLYYIQPVKNITQLELTWALPSFLDKYKTKPHQVVSWILGHEGKGSLLSYLRQKVWVLMMSTGNSESGSEHSTIYSLFSINMVLTEDGLKNVDKIIELTFAYLRMLKEIGPQERIFEEIKMIENTSFRFMVEEAAVDLVEELSEAMHFYPSIDYLTGSQTYEEYDPNLIDDVINALKPNTVNIAITSNDLPDGIKFDKTEKWFGTKYTDCEIPIEWIKNWQNVKKIPDFIIPEPNKYLTKDFTILPKDENHPDYPEKILNTNLVELWYRKDQKFELPISIYCFHLINPEALKTALNATMLELYVNLLLLNLVEEGYPAVVADLDYDIKTDERGLVIKLKGYNEKLPLLLELITKHLLNFHCHLRQDVFDAVKDKLTKYYYNVLLKPNTLAKDGRLKLIINKHYTNVEKYNANSAITYDNIKQFGAELLKNVYIKALIQGNISKSQAGNIVDKFVSDLNCKQIEPESYPIIRVHEVPIGEIVCRMESFNPDDCNSIITNYYQAGPYSTKDNVMIELIMLIIEEPLFDTLRTKEQLGYNVYCSLRETYGILGFTITVNARATKHTPQYVNNRIDDFMINATHLINQTTSKQFDEIRKDLIKTKQCIDVHLKEEVTRNWYEIIEDSYRFDQMKQEIKAIEVLHINDVKKWWVQHSAQENIKKLSIQVSGFCTPDESGAKSLENYGKEMNIKFLNINKEDPTELSKNFIIDMEAFKEKQPLLPDASIRHAFK